MILLKLNLILRGIEDIYQQGVQLMSKETDLEQLVSDLNDETNAVAAKIDGQTQAIADLKAQIAAGAPVSQEQLDSLAAGFAGVSDKLRALGAPDAPPPAPPA